MKVSVVIPAYQPRADELAATLDALRAQTLPLDAWELVLVDNRSDPPVDPAAVAWHPHGRCIREEQPGLVHSRAAGFRQSSADVIIVVDQDNVLAPDYLATALEIAAAFPRIGAWGAGVIAPRYERPELAPPPSLRPLLTLRESAADAWSNDIHHHDSTPWGAGLCIRRAVAGAYLGALQSNPEKSRLDLRGTERLSGGDTDIAYTACAMGLGKGVFPRLRIEHLIPASRCTAAFLCRTGEGRGYSEVLHHLVLTGRLPAARTGLAWMLRHWRRRSALSSIERQVDRAMESGRQRALRELSHPGSPRRP
ncbi:MAG TPA: glycosyltransferase [Opitutaceae bacterium]|nr:glycosyltransferase [Opitutaceae bacterium]